MTTQNVQAVIGNNRLSKIFNKSDSTDGQWDGNTLTDSLSNQQIGILMPSTSINRVSCQYTGGLSAWRIQNSNTLTFQRWGFGVKDGFACWDSQGISPYTINPNDILTVYPLAVNGGVNTTDSLAWIQTSKGVELFKATSVDGTPTAMTSVVNSLSLGDAFFNSTLSSIMVQCEDGATLDSVEIIDNQGGTIFTAYGSVRGDSGGSMSLEYNLYATGLQIPIGKGFSIRVNTTTG